MKSTALSLYSMGRGFDVRGWLRNRNTPWMLAVLAPVVLGPIWGLLADRIPGVLGTFTGLILVLLLASCTITDLTRHKIYNWATYPAVLWGLAVNTLAGAEPSALGAVGRTSSLFGLAVCFGMTLVAYRLARGGAGDVKLAMAIGVLLGVHNGVLAIAYSYVVGGIFILAWTLWQQGPIALARALVRKVGSLFVPRWIAPPDAQDCVLLDKPVPLAGFFAVGTFLVMLEITLQ